MPQFNVKSLARLLTQVEREVLVKAIEEAELGNLFLTAHTATLEELQGFFNLFANIHTFGFDVLEKLLEEAKEDIGPVTLSVVTFIIEQFVSLADIGDAQPKHEEKLEDLQESAAIVLEQIDILSGIVEERAEEVLPDAINTARALLQSAADNLRFAESELFGRDSAALRAVIDARFNVEAAFLALS